MANRFLSNIRINDAYTFPASDGSNGQVIVTDGSGNLAFANPTTSSSASIIYRDNFTGDGSTVAFTLQNSLSDEDQTFIYIDGVYQEKGTYSLSTNTITFTTAPDIGHSIEVISVSGINVGPTTIYQDNFTGDGTTTNFTLAQVIDNEVKTMIYFNGVYQFKGTYSLNGTALSFDTAPANGVNIEVISIASAAAADYNQKVLFYGKATQAISKGDAIMLGGQEGDHFLLSKATQTAIAANHEYFLGLASQDLAQGEFGYVTEFGKITELDTSGYTAGNILWFDAGGSTAGALTTTEPAPPLVKIQVAAVIRSHQNEGVLFIRPSWYHELGELHDVNVTSVADKDMLVWDNANGYWENTKALGDITATSLDINGVSDLNGIIIGTNADSINKAGNLYIQTTTSSDLILRTNSIEALRIKSDKSTVFAQGAISIPVGGISHYTNNYLYIKGGTAGAAIGNDDFSGAVYIADSSDITLTTSNSDAVVIKSSGNVGINTSSPDSILHLHGDTTSWASSPTIIMSSSSTANANIRNWRIGPADTNYGNFHIGVSSTQGGIVDSDSEGSTFTIDYQGKVGIGTKSPAAKLHVEIDTASETDVARFRTINGADNHFLDISVDNTNNLVAYDSSGASSGDHVFRTGGTERMRVTSSGQLQLPYGNASALNGGEGVITDPGTFTGMKLYGSSDGNLKIFNVRNNSSFGNILFYTGTGTERMRVGYNGNIGIATDAPDYGLDVQTTLRMRDVGQVIGFDTTGSANSVQLYTANDYEFHIVNSRGNSSKLLLGNSNISLGTSSTPLLFINTNTNNVGIGTTSPSEKFEVNGTIAAIASSYPTVKVQGSDVNYQGRMRWDTNNNVLEFLTRHAGTYYGDTLVLKQGKVGIGTNSPAQKFVVYETGSDTWVADFSSVNAASYVNIGNSSNNSYANIGLVTDLGTAQMWHAGSSYGSNWGGNNSFNFYTPSVGFHWHPGGSANAMVLTTNRRLGINKTNPDYTLDVEGRAAFTDEILARSSTTSITNAGYVWQGKFTGNGIYIHLKTNLGWGANTQMYSWHFLGYAYGMAAPVDAKIGFYNYPPSGAPINIGSSGTHSIVLYQSSDGYIVVRIQFTSSYYTGLTMSARNTAQGVAWPSITSTAQNGTANHF